MGSAMVYWPIQTSVAVEETAGSIPVLVGRNSAYGGGIKCLISSDCSLQMLFDQALPVGYTLLSGTWTGGPITEDATITLNSNGRVVEVSAYTAGNWTVPAQTICVPNQTDSVTLQVNAPVSSAEHTIRLYDGDNAVAEGVIPVVSQSGPVSVRVAWGSGITANQIGLNVQIDGLYTVIVQNGSIDTRYWGKPVSDEGVSFRGVSNGDSLQLTATMSRNSNLGQGNVYLVFTKDGTTIGYATFYRAEQWPAGTSQTRTITISGLSLSENTTLVLTATAARPTTGTEYVSSVVQPSGS